MSRLLEQQADTTYASLVRHLDTCCQCQAAGGNPSLMCDLGAVTHRLWENAEFRANQDAAGECDARH